MDEVLICGVQPVRTVLRALALKHLHDGKSTGEVAAMVRLTPKAVRQIGRRYEDFTISRDLERLRCWTIPSDSALLLWSAVTLPRAVPAGPCGWWPKKP